MKLARITTPLASAALFAVAIAVGPPSPAEAQNGASAQADTLGSARAFEAAKARLQYEPGAAETLRAALRYFRVDPESFDDLRTAARVRALLPTLSGGYRFDNVDLSRAEISTGDPTYDLDENQNRRDDIFTIGAVFDFRELVFNPAEVQVYGLIGVQRDLMLETTRVYYLRKQLFVRFLNKPPEDPIAREALLLRIEELTALLDVLSGGWFSEETERRVRERRRTGNGNRNAAR